LVMNDQTGGGDFNNLWLMGSVAYHLSLDKKEKMYLSVGVQGGYVSKRLDTNSQIFADQLDGSGNPTINTMENFANTDVGGGDLRAGVVFSGYPSAKMNYKIGVSYMHLLQTEEIFLDGSTENVLPARIAFFGQGEFMTKNPKFRIMPEILFLNQASVNEINVTSNFGYKVNPSFELIFGGGYRVSDAAIANMGFEFKGVEFLASYDVNLSDLSTASQYQGGFEISLGYVGRILPKQKANLPCIRFY
ncbi:MAG: PorP/SprF family type IX secretion system membrane protein, partial [Saprospiraceae bacterium]